MYFQEMFVYTLILNNYKITKNVFPSYLLF